MLFSEGPSRPADNVPHRGMADDLCSKAPLVWDWDIEHTDRKSEAKADAAVHGAPPFQVDRKLLKDIVQEKMGEDVVRIRFLGAGTFHKVSGYCDSLAWLLQDPCQLVGRPDPEFDHVRTCITHPLADGYICPDESSPVARFLFGRGSCICIPPMTRCIALISADAAHAGESITTPGPEY